MRRLHEEGLTISSVNKAIILGYLGGDPESRFTADGNAVTTFRIATTERYKNKQGEQQETTEWHRCVTFGKTAEVAGEYLLKGQLCYVEGRLQTRKWQDKEGQDRYTTEIVVDQLRFFRKPGDEERPAREPAAKPAPARAAKPAKARGTGFEDMPDDIPFAILDIFLSDRPIYRPTSMERARHGAEAMQNVQAKARVR